MTKRIKGSIAAATGFFLWGILPVYWKSIDHVPSFEILNHRIIWSFVFMAILLTITGKWHRVKAAITHRSGLIFLLSSIMIGANWMLYIWAVNHEHIVEASLGYFINPLVNVLFGVLFLKEKLRRLEKIAFIIAIIGVAYMTFRLGRFPWVAIGLALNFGTYGLLRKIARAGSMEGLFIETTILSLFGFTYLATLQSNGTAAFVNDGLFTSIFLFGAGAMTAVPLLLFTFGARRIKLSTLGFLQYLAPTFQLLSGTILFKEAFTIHHLISFALIWTALIFYSISNYSHRPKKHRIPKGKP